MTNKEFEEKMAEYRKVCKGCMNENCSLNICNNRSVLDCYLRKTYLPEGLWSMAAKADVINSCVDNLSKEIDKHILEGMDLSKYE